MPSLRSVVRRNAPWWSAGLLLALPAARARSQVNLPRAWQADAAWTYAAALPGTAMPPNGRIDIRVGRNLAGLELSQIGQNLSERRHREFGGYEGVFHRQAPRAWVARAAWRF